jgi:hypothetical protein
MQQITIELYRGPIFAQTGQRKLLPVTIALTFDGFSILPFPDIDPRAVTVPVEVAGETAVGPQLWVHGVPAAGRISHRSFTLARVVGGLCGLRARFFRRWRGFFHRLGPPFKPLSRAAAAFASDLTKPPRRPSDTAARSFFIVSVSVVSIVSASLFHCSNLLVAFGQWSDSAPAKVRSHECDVSAYKDRVFAQTGLFGGLPVLNFGNRIHDDLFVDVF